jgi:hypothetical protein
MTRISLGAAVSGLASICTILVSVILVADWLTPQKGDDPTASHKSPKATDTVETSISTSPNASVTTKQAPEPLEPVKFENDTAFRNLYLLPLSTGKGSKEGWALVIRGDDTMLLSRIVTAVEKLLAENNIPVVSIFRPQLVDDSLHKALLDGDTSLVQRLALQQYCAGVLVGEITSTSFVSAELASLVTMTVMLRITIIRTASTEINSLLFSAKGGGFSREAAGAQAAERITVAIRDTLSNVVR